MQDVARLQHRDPFAHRVMTETGLFAEGTEVEQLPGAPRAQAQEMLKLHQVADVDQLPDIALQIGLEVISTPDVRIEPTVEDRWIAPREERVVQRLRQQIGLRKLTRGKRQQAEQRNTASEALRNAGQQAELLRAGQHKAPRSLMLVDHPLQPGEQVRAALNLVHNRAVRIPVQKSPRVILSKLALRRILQRHVVVGMEERTGQSGLSRLSRSGDGQNGVSTGELAQRVFGDSWDLAANCKLN